MRRFYLLILLSFIGYISHAQPAASYTFSAFAGTYTSIAGSGTPVTSILADDVTQLNIPIGFTFNFCGTNYSQLSANTNGFLSLSNSGLTTYINAAGNVVGPGMLMAYWDDLYGNATLYGCSAISHAYYITTGTAPNRVFTFEWKDMEAFGWTGVCTCCTIDLQIKLYESSNLIDYIYGGSTYSGMSATIGIANSISDWQTLSDAGTSPTHSSTAFTTTIPGGPANGQIYRWSNQCTGTPVTGSISATVSSGCAPYTSVLSLPSSSLGMGLSYQWQSSPDGTSWSVITGATNDTYTASVTANTWYRCKMVCSYSTLSATSPSLELFFSTPPSGISGPATVCEGATINLTDPTPGGSWSSSNTSIATIGSSTGILSGVSSGSVLISYTLPGGCSTMTTINVMPGPTAITGVSSICAGSTTLFSNSVAGGRWTSSAPGIALVDTASGVVSGVASGIVMISYTIGSCSVFKAVSVNPSPLPISGPIAVCVGSSITLHAASGGGIWTSSNPAVALAGTSSGIVSGISAGNVSISYTLPGGCAVGYAITVNPLPPSISGPSSVCAGQVTFLSCSGGGIWSSSNVAIAKVGSSSGVVTGVAAGSARITYTLPTGCFSILPMTVNPLPAPITGVAAFCVGANNILSDATPGGTWSTGLGGFLNINPLSGLDTGISAGVEVVSYTLSTGCAVTKLITVNPLPLPISGYPRVCVGTTITLFESGAGVWNSGTPSVATIDSTGIVTGLTPGNTTISYTLSGGCATSVVVTVIPSPAAITGAASVCEGANIILTDATPGGLWSTTAMNASVGSSSGIVTGIFAGMAVISYSSILTGCSATKTITINPLPPAISGPFALCAGSSITETDSVTGGTWLSSNPSVATIGSVTGLLTGVVVGSTAITYTSPAGCRTTSMVTVTPGPSSIFGSSTLCITASTTLTNTVPGGLWSSSTGGVTIGSLSGIATGVTLGAATITYSLGPGCTVTKPITVVAVPAPITGTVNVCVGARTTLSDITTGGRWSSSSIAIVTVGSSTGIVTGVSAGVAGITYTGLWGCIALVQVTVNLNPAAISGPAVVCTGSTVTESDITPGGLWSTSATTVNIGSATGVVGGMAAGIAPITYSVGGCNATRIMTVNAMAPITGATGICTGNTTLLHDATPGGTWSSSNPPIAGIGSLSGIVTGIYPGSAVITYNVSPGCAVTTTVNVNSTPSVILGNRYLCVGTTTLLSDAAPGGTWSSSNPSVAIIGSLSGLVSGNDTGTATITYSLGFGCTTTAVVTVNPLLPAITGAAAICIGHSATLANSRSGGSWSSSNTAIAPVGATGIVTGAGIGTSVISYSAGGCVTTKTVTINALPAAISGPGKVCVAQTITLTDMPAGGIWSSRSPVIASVDSVSGVVTGNLAGTVVISYSPGVGCSATTTVTVDPLPAGIAGGSAVCIGTTTTLSDVTPGGTWSSGAPSVASVNSSGVVRGISGGGAVISYTIATGCSIAHMVSVIVVPPIMGLTNLCAWGDTVNIFDSVAAGSYTSSSVTVLNLGGGAGVVTTAAPGPASVTYTLSGYGCFVTQLLTVNPLPGPISGNDRICSGFTSAFSSTTPGGAWSSADAAIVSIGAASGIATGHLAGSTQIIYKLPTGCHIDTTVNVVSMPSAITGVAEACAGATTTLADAVSGGAWISGNPAVATVGASTGLVTGITPGMAIITYTNAVSCAATKIVTIDPLPVIYTVTGGGNYCAGGAGLHIGLAGSLPGARYQLYLGAIAIGTPFTGTGSSIDFGAQTAAGIYTVGANNIATGCAGSMGGSASIMINPTVTPSVTMSVAPGDTVCVGTLATFNATPVNGGATPAYQWSINGVVASFGPSYAYIPVNGDLVKVLLTSNAACATPDTAADTHTITVDEMLVPSVSVSAQPGISIIAGQYDTLTAVVAGGGSTLLYQWELNAVAIPGETNAVFISNSFNNGDVISCVVTSTGLCGGFSDSNQVMLVVSAYNGVKQHSRSVEMVAVSPNPNKGEFTVSGTLGSSVSEEVMLSITDILGRVVYADNIIAKAGKLNEHIILSKSLANGVYLLTLRAGDDVKVFHIVVEQ